MLKINQNCCVHANAILVIQNIKVQVRQIKNAMKHES